MKPTEHPPGRFEPSDSSIEAEESAADAVLLAELGELLDVADPVPPHLVDYTRFALELDDFEVEVARWSSMEPLVGVRSRSAPSTITFTVEDLTVMVSLAPVTGGNRFDGWLVPGGPHTVEVRVDGHGATRTDADEGGRFALSDVPRGLTQILVHLAGPIGSRSRTVVTPTIVL